MDIMELGAIGELVGGVAVIATLIYLAMQVKQSSQASKIASYHQGIAQIVESALDPDFATLLAKHTEDSEGLTNQEELRLTVLTHALLFGHEIIYGMYQRGQVDDIEWQNLFENNFWLLLSHPFAVELARSRPGVLSRRLFALIEAALEDGRPRFGDAPA